MKRLKQNGMALAVLMASSLFIPGSIAATQAPQNNNSEAAKPHRYIGEGKIVQVTFGDFAFRLDFTDSQTMTFTGNGPASEGITDTVQYTAVEIRPQVYMVYWHEPTTGDNVTHVQDYPRGIVYTNIASGDGSFTHLKGQIKIIGNSGEL